MLPILQFCDCRAKLESFVKLHREVIAYLCLGEFMHARIALGPAGAGAMVSVLTG